MNPAATKKGFPWGIFLVLFFALTLLSLGVSTVYLWYVGRSRVDESVRNSKKYSTTMVEALANVAELSYASGNYSRLKMLFAEKIGDNSSIEAFFIRADGKIVAHSSGETVKDLQGNIANDEFAYNLDLILLPLRSAGREVLFLDYNIMDRTIPFTRDQRLLIKNFLYSGIQSTGWLATRAVFVKRKAIGTLNFIIAKEKIYQVLTKLVMETLLLLAFLQSMAFLISLFISLVVYFRFRGLVAIAEKELHGIAAGLAHTMREPEWPAAGRTPVMSYEKPTIPESHKAIKDAIPIVK